MRFQCFKILTWSVLMFPMGVQAQSVESFHPAGAGLPLFRPPGAVAVIARATPQWVAVPTDPHTLLGDYQFLPTYATDDTEGQLFEVLQSEPGLDTLDSAGLFLAVPWTVGCGCAEEGWDEPTWVPPGDTVAFILSPTRRGTSWDGPPVFDVLGWHQPYPAAEFVPYWRWSREEPEVWLSVSEFFCLLLALPGEAAFRLDPTSSLRAVEKWLEENPSRAEAFPVPSILWELGRLTGGR